MSTFAYYNPITNTVEKRFPFQAQIMPIPYLLNMQPGDFNYSIRITNEMRSNPAFVQYPTSLRNNENNHNNERENEKLAYNTEQKPQLSSSTYKNEFLIMEDLHESNLDKLPPYYQPQKEAPKMNTQPFTIHEQSRTNQALTMKPIQYQRELAKGEFKLMRPEELTLSQGPQGLQGPQEIKLSTNMYMNDRLPNSRFVQEEQEKTRKLITDIINTDIQVLEHKADDLERDFKVTQRQTLSLDEKTKKIRQEFERKRFEIEASKAMKKIDQYTEKEIQEDPQKRFLLLLKENEALYQEVDRALNVIDEEEEENEFIETYRSNHSRISVNSAKGKSRQQGLRSRSRGQEYLNTNTRQLLDQKIGRRNVMKSIPEEKTRKLTKHQMDGLYRKGNFVANRKELTVKNPKKVEVVLQKAKEIASLY